MKQFQLFTFLWTRHGLFRQKACTALRYKTFKIYPNSIDFTNDCGTNVNARLKVLFRGRIII